MDLVPTAVHEHVHLNRKEGTTMMSTYGIWQLTQDRINRLEQTARRHRLGRANRVRRNHPSDASVVAFRPATPIATAPYERENERVA